MNTDAMRGHIDAETMAAWADRALSADAAAEVELHLSNCERCQEVLAAFMRSEPAAGAVVLPFWTRRPVQWSAAGLAAAAALVAMIWIGRPPAAPAPESTVAARDVAPTAPSASAPPELRQDKPAPVDQIAQPSAAAQPSRASKSSPKPAEPRQEKSANAAGLQRDQAASALQDRAAAEQARELGRVALAPPPRPTPAAVMPPAAPPATAVTAAAPAVSPPATTPVVAPVGATKPVTMFENVATDAFSAVIPIIEIAAPELTPSALRSTAGAGGRTSGLAAAMKQSTAGTTRWRIVNGTRVERTIDAGATWTPLPIEPELKTLLLAGSATSPTNCWLVGRDGVVLVTHDGRTFRRVSVPEVVHLTGVTAMDGMRATVTAIDGRKFSTIDGGLTWK